MRNLASVVSVKDVIPMYQKDKIVCVTFNENAYEAIVPKECGIAGKNLVFIQEGSVLPVEPRWEFLRKRCFNESWNGFIIKPITMGKKSVQLENGEVVAGERVKSWGLAVTFEDCGIEEDSKVGTDLTETLNIRKYEEAEESLSCSPTHIKTPRFLKFCFEHRCLRWIAKLYVRFNKQEKQGFPTDIISKSDETTLQNMPWVLEKFKNEPYCITAKMEGQSVTALFDYDSKKKKIGKFYVCSRSVAYRKRVNNVFWNTAIRLDIERKIKTFYKKHGVLLVIQAEQCGPGIQKNIYDLPYVDWYVYTIKDAITGMQFNPMKMYDICYELKLKTVPVVKVGRTLGEVMPDVKTAVDFAEKVCWKKPSNCKDIIATTFVDDKNLIWKKYCQHEGVVVRSINYDKDSNVGYSFKIKNMQYQEKGLEEIGKIALNL